MSIYMIQIQDEIKMSYNVYTIYEIQFIVNSLDAVGRVSI